jgi:glycerol-3-phosphate dehydrogenase
MARLQDETFDILVIGGGITGAGIARDAALRGFRTALVEKGDFASGTSSKSSKLIHGGIRYLENFEFGLVFEASQERRRLRKIAPHLVKPLPFLMPIYRSSKRGYWLIRAGMWLYDILALFRNVQRHRMLRPQAVAASEPEVDQRDLAGAARFYDCQVDDARLTLATILDASRYGAVVTNYTQVVGLLKDGGWVVGAQVRDVLSGEEFAGRARVTLNATGVWVDEIQRLDDPGTVQQLRPTKGIHVLVPRQRFNNRHAVAFTSPADGRLMFLVPWGRYALIGTTDTDYQGDLDRVYAEGQDVQYVLDAVNSAFPTVRLTRDDVVSTFAGTRPLISEQIASSYKVSREHKIFDSPSGFLSIAGGKLTTYRAMAEQMVDIAAKRLQRDFGRKPPHGCCTDKRCLDPGDVRRVEADQATLARQGQAHGLDSEVMCHLVAAYGTDYTRLLELVASNAMLGQRLIADLPYVWAEVSYAVQQEMAMTLTDVLARRTHLLYEDRQQGLGVAEPVAQLMAQDLGWGPGEVARQVATYRQEVELTRLWRENKV